MLLAECLGRKAADSAIMGVMSPPSPCIDQGARPRVVDALLTLLFRT